MFQTIQFMQIMQMDIFFRQQNIETGFKTNFQTISKQNKINK